MLTKSSDLYVGYPQIVLFVIRSIDPFVMRTELNDVASCHRVSKDCPGKGLSVVFSPGTRISLRMVSIDNSVMAVVTAELAIFERR